MAGAICIVVAPDETVSEKRLSNTNPLPVNVVAGGIGSNASVGANGAPIPGSSTLTGWDDGGTLVPISAANPLPISGSISASTTAVATAAAPSYGEGDPEPLSQNLLGDLRVIAKQSGAWTVALGAGSALVGSVGIDQSTPGTTNAVDATNFPVTVATGAGNSDADTIRAVICSNQAAIPVTGTFFQATQPVSIATAPALVASSALVGDVGLQLRAGNGLLTHYLSCTNSNNATSVKGSAGSIGAIRVFNNSANIAYLKLYNKASAPNPASDTPVDKIMIPANTSGAGAVISMPYGQLFTTGIAFAVVAGFGDTDNTSVAASAFSVTILYQ